MARPKSQPSDDPDVRKTVSLTQSTWEEISAYQKQERIKAEAEALRRVVEEGLRALKAKRDKP